jgi:hypothetical protein
MVPSLQAMTSFATVAGLSTAMQKFGQFGTQIGFSARRAGVAIEQLDALKGAMQLAGGSADSAAAGITTFRDTLTDAIGGGNPQALQYLNQFGIQFRGVGLTAKNVQEVLPQALDAINKIADPSLQYRVAQAFFGGSAEDFIKLSRGGARSYAELTEQAKKYGLWTDESAAAARRFTLAETKAELAAKGLGIGIMTGLEPAFTWMANGFANLYLNHREGLTRFGEVLGGIAGARTVLMLGRVGYALFGVGAAVRTMVSVADGVLGSSLLWQFLSGAWLPGFLRLMGPVGAFVAGMWPSTANAGESSKLDELFPNRHNGALPGLGPQASPSTGAIPPGLAARQKDTFGMLTGLGYSPAAAAAMVAGFSRESGLDPNSSNIDSDGLMHRGIASWSPERQALYEKIHHHPFVGSSLQEQLAFADWELHNTERRAGGILFGAKTPSQATLGELAYERPGNPTGAYGTDAPLAERLYQQYGPPMATPGGAVASDPGRVQLDVNVNHNNAPAGATMDVQTRNSSTAVDLRPPRVVRAMQGTN